MKEIGLGEAIRALREELTEAKGQGEGAWMRFQVGPVNLELQLVVEKDVHGQVGWKIVELGGAAGSERTQKVTLMLTPQWWDDASKQYTTDFLVAGSRPSFGEDSTGPIDRSAAVPKTDADPEDDE